MRLIYLDYNTTTPMAGGAREAMLPFLYEFYGSPNSSHWTGAAVAEAIEDARTHVAMLLDCESHEIIFTSGGTESVNLAIRSGIKLLEHNSLQTPQIVLTTWEYEAAYRTATDLAGTGYDVRVVSSGSKRGWQPEHLAEAIGDRPTLLSLTLADGDVGLVQQVVQLVQLLEQSGQREHCLIHVDCCQAVGKIDVSAQMLSVDLFSISGHKMYAVKGIGALFVRDGSLFQSMFGGEYYERGMRLGTPNVPGIISMGAAAELMSKSVRKFALRSEQLFSQFGDVLDRCCSEIITLPNSKDAVGLPNTRLLLLPERTSAIVLQRLPEICVKSYVAFTNAAEEQTVAANNFRVRKMNDVAAYEFDALTAFGLTQAERLSCLRISVGWNTTEAEIIHAAESISEAYHQTSME